MVIKNLSSGIFPNYTFSVTLPTTNISKESNNKLQTCIFGVGPWFVGHFILKWIIKNCFKP